VGKTGSHHNGEIQSGSAKLSAAGYDFVDARGADCTLTLWPAGVGVGLTQTGACSNDFGAFLDGSGTYAKATGDWVGVYNRSDVQGSGQVVILSANPLVFDLTVVMNGGSNHNGDIENGTATLSSDNNQATYRDGNDCTIVMSHSDVGLDVSQTGACSGNFGAFVDASGSFIVQ
jgi:hypothetical protein